VTVLRLLRCCHGLGGDSLMREFVV
jgi:hypothetical protein